MALKGNQFWKLRAKHGRDKLFATPELLKEACEEYFEWVEDNPLVEEKIFCSKNGIQHGHLEKMRAMTIEGLCTFLDITRKTWIEWRTVESAGLSEVVAWADGVMRTQKLTGAAADMLNANIIARDLGLKENTESTVDVRTSKKLSEEDEKLLERLGVKID